jgi:hypothetical protein
VYYSRQVKERSTCTAAQLRINGLQRNTAQYNRLPSREKEKSARGELEACKNRECDNKQALHQQEIAWFFPA